MENDIDHAMTAAEMLPAIETDKLADTIARAKREIEADIANGVVPAACASYSELHDYVDANGYGGAFEHDFENEETDFWNAVQDAVDAWIKAGELRAAGRITTRSISPGGWRLIRDAIDAGAIVTGYGAVRYAHEGLRVASRYAHRQMRSYSRAEQRVSFDEHGY